MYGGLVVGSEVADVHQCSCRWYVRFLLVTNNQLVRTVILMLWCEYMVCHSTGVSGYIRCIWPSASPPSSVGLMVKGCVVHPSIMLSGGGYPQGVDWAVEWIIDTSESWQPCLHELLGSIRRNTLTDLIGPCKNWVEADPRGAATLVWLVSGNEWMGKLCDTLKSPDH